MQQLILPKETSRLVALSSIGQAVAASLAGARVLVVENDFIILAELEMLWLKPGQR